MPEKGRNHPQPDGGVGSDTVGEVWSQEGQKTAHEKIISRLSLIVKILPILAVARILLVGRTDPPRARLATRQQHFAWRGSPELSSPPPSRRPGVLGQKRSYCGEDVTTALRTVRLRPPRASCGPIAHARTGRNLPCGTRGGLSQFTEG